ncbi:hypothetical protein NB501_05445 [Vibrio alginolyticus]|uniref:hypothetical protein n=1 Tax=Vibrio alginolyticus TaxID=663 RepID=UPI00215C5027|nr:hypothetical protein [Vibrio alginolyticus]ELK2252454.1 hypothetical protein [Vibrio vulnificus]MCR9574894.1 hypothetical protein [Vibrio alginolyticus]
MKITKVENGFEVNVDYELKDLFKKSFPSAKWQSQSKTWKVGPRSGKRLEQWVSEVDGLAAEIKEKNDLKESSLIVEKEYDELRYDVIKLSESVNAEKRRLESYISNKTEMIEEATEEKEELSKALEFVKKQVQDTLEDLNTVKIETEQVKKDLLEESRKIFEALLDTDEISSSLSMMQRQTGQVSTRCREQWQSAKDKLIEAYDTLKNHGYYSKGLDEITDLNWNKQRRSGVTTARDFSYDDFLELKEIEQ